MKCSYLGSSRERSRIIVHVIFALDVANSKHTWRGVNVESPISNGLTTVARYSGKIQLARLLLGPKKKRTWGKD